jgi:hypothetical protein
MLLAFVDTPQRHHRITIFPVVAADEPQLSYILLADALRRGVLTLEENGPGEAPCFIAQNRSTQPVLILGSETVVGDLNPRSVFQTVLLGPDSVTRVPTSDDSVSKWSCAAVEAQFSDSLKEFPLLDNQVGILAFMGRDLLGLDILGTPELYAPLHRRLLTCYLITALTSGEKGKMESPAEEAEMQALAMALEGAHREAAPCPGHGEYATIHGDVTGGELRHNGHLVHLSVCPNGAAA